MQHWLTNFNILQKEFKLFYAKILLFGEYAIINGAEGLAIPLDKFFLKFTFTKDENVFHQSNEFLKQYLEYIDINFDKSIYDINSFKEDIQNGLMVSSSIPIGFGLGSSGALVAAFYDQYCLKKEIHHSIPLLKAELGKLESFFHGASSGLDPLVSYLNQAIHIENSDKIHALSFDPKFNSELNLFLLNSTIERRTAPLVELFKTKLLKSDFSNNIHDVLIPLNNKIIKAYLNQDKQTVFDLFNKISIFQYEYMREMIPDIISEIFNTDKYHLKICGAGGGGFYLGIGDSKPINTYDIIKL